jgi:cellulose synthase operon protein C
MCIALRQCAILTFFAWVLLSSGTPPRAGEADDQFAVAAGHYDNQRWKMAIEEFQAFVEKYPDDPRVNQGVFFLGEALLQLGKTDDARRHFQTYTGRDPQGKYAKAALFRSAEAAYLAGNFDAAKPELDRFLAKHPEDRLNAYVLPYLGDIALAKNDPAAAAGFYRNGLKLFPEGNLQDDCRFGLARALEKQRQPDEAERLYREVAAKPKSSLADAAQFHLGAMQYAAGQYEKAVETFSLFEDRLASSAWQPNARLGLGMALLKLDRPDDADKHFDAVLETKSAGEKLSQQAAFGKFQTALQRKDYAAVDRLSAEFEKRFPDSPMQSDVQRMLAKSFVERKDFARAVTLLEALSGKGAAETKDLNNRYLLALCYEGLNRYEEALAALLPVVDNAEGQLQADAQLLQGTLLLALKKYQEATTPLEAFVAGKPTGDAQIKALCELAICCARTGRIDKAKKLYAEVIQIDPHHPLIAPTVERLADAAYDANDTAWSEELSGKLATASNSAEYELKGKLGIGWSQYKAGKLAEAAETFDAVLKKNPPEAIAAEAALVRGRILEEQGRNEQALAMFNLVIERYPTSKQHGDALFATGQLHEKQNQKPQAAALYARLAKEHPQFPSLDNVLYKWAWVSQELGYAKDADRIFDQIHKTYPQSRFWADSTYRLAQRAFDAKDFDHATGLIRELLAAKTEPQIREFALSLQGQIAVAKADWPVVRQTFEEMAKEFPDSPRRISAEFWIAEACYHQADYKDASERLEKLCEKIAKKREPWMGVIPLRRAQILVQRKQFADALAIAAKIEKEFPNFNQQYEADYVIGRCLADQADFEAARNAYAKVIQSAAGAKTETAAMAQWMIGETYFHQKNYEAACKEYLRLEILYAYPEWQAGALLQAGKCYALLGDAKLAAEQYQKILKVYPSTSFAKDAAAEAAKISRPSANP